MIQTPSNSQKLINTTTKHLNRFSLLLLALTLPFTREFNGVNLIVLNLFFLFISIINFKTLLQYKLITSFSLFSLTYAALSAFQIFPQTWTRLYDITAIPQQALFSYTFPFLLIALVTFFKQEGINGPRRKNISIYFFLLWIYTKIVNFSMNPDATLFDLISISGLGNTTALISTALALYLSTINSKLAIATLVVGFLSLSIMSIFSQNYIYGFFALLIWLLPRQSMNIFLALLFCAFTFYLIFIFTPTSVYFIDANLTVRLVLLKDALEGFYQSNLIGVGFGTEGIKNQYNYRLFDEFFYDENKEGFIHLAVHNSYATILFRTGLIGFTLFALFLLKTYRKVRYIKNKTTQTIMLMMLGGFFLVTYLNPALESFVYLYGSILYISVIWALEDKETDVSNHDKKNKNTFSS